MTGPDTGGPPSGPRNTPLTEEVRMLGYFTQNGRWRLTPRQRRRVEHKSNRAASRAVLAR